MGVLTQNYNSCVLMFTATDVRCFQMDARLSVFNFLEKKLCNNEKLQTSFIVFSDASHEILM